METQYRDNAIAKSRLLLNLTFVWASVASVVAIILAILSLYLVFHKETHWLPLCTGEEFVVSEATYSPQYLKDMSERIAYLRLTYSPETVSRHFKTLLSLTPANHQEAFKSVLDEECETVIKKDISSTFYVEKIRVDVSHARAQITGHLHRASHGMQLKADSKAYELQFSYKDGLLGLASMKEMYDARN